MGISYGNATADEFLSTYGRHIEDRLKDLSSGKIEVEKLEATYDSQNVRYLVHFKWGTDPNEAYKEVQILMSGFASQFTQEMRDSMNVWNWGENTGFLSISFFSNKRNLDELYNLLEPVISPLVSKVGDASYVDLWNPNRKAIQVELNPERMSSVGLYPKDVALALSGAMTGSSGGTVTSGVNKFDVTMTRQIKSLNDVGSIIVPTPSGGAVHLSDVAYVDYGVPRSSERSFKTSGASSLILYAEPKPGGNIKKMSENIIDAIRSLKKTLPDDIDFKILVDPSEFIRSAVSNVFREVVMAALLAVFVLFIFVGSLKNVVTAAIEIPISIILAFILMRAFGINLNLISLGGLALSAGMNVDASVVVMENIFRHFESVNASTLSLQARARIVGQAVSEVAFPVIASTIASIVVFLPLAFTNGLSNSLLQDLALAVVFSHGFSAIVALILVPTIRLQIMAAGGASHGKSPIEKTLSKIETFYVRNLEKFLNSRRLKLMTYASLCALLVALSVLIIPRLPKEIIGRPDTDWIYLGVNTQGNTLTKQMESTVEQVESRLIAKYGEKIQYTFTQVNNPNGASIMARLIDKHLMTEVWKSIERDFANTPETSFYVFPWNPSELSIPDPPNFQVAVRGTDPIARTDVANKLNILLQDKKVFPNISTKPGVWPRESIEFNPYREQWALLAKQGIKLAPGDIADISRVATQGRRVGVFPMDGNLVDVDISYPEGRIASLDDLAAFPIGVHGKLAPLKSLISLNIKPLEPILYNIDERGVDLVTGKVHEEDRQEGPAKTLEAEKIVNQWKAENKIPEGISVNFEDAQIEMNEALQQLEQAVGISILLIFLTMVFQFGSFMNALIVMVSIPLGFIGVLSSLAIFKSTLSLNSVLGVILLNGIAVANSIILVDFLKKLVARGMTPHNAALEAAQKRLRPILMTSLTTALGMLPIALGFGEGGRILQPLGIAVVGGLGFSVLMTLFVVPSLQVSYLEWRRKRKGPSLVIVESVPSTMDFHET